MRPGSLVLPMLRPRGILWSLHARGLGIECLPWPREYDGVLGSSPWLLGPALVGAVNSGPRRYMPGFPAGPFGPQGRFLDEPLAGTVAFLGGLGVQVKRPDVCQAPVEKHSGGRVAGLGGQCTGCSVRFPGWGPVPSQAAAIPKPRFIRRAWRPPVSRPSSCLGDPLGS